MCYFSFKYFSKGLGVSVTILDDGIEKDHPDLIRYFICFKNHLDLIRYFIRRSQITLLSIPKKEFSLTSNYQFSQPQTRSYLFLFLLDPALAGETIAFWSNCTQLTFCIPHCNELTGFRNYDPLSSTDVNDNDRYYIFKNI